jgi:predicted phosphodiesterase
MRPQIFSMVRSTVSPRARGASCAARGRADLYRRRRAAAGVTSWTMRAAVISDIHGNRWALAAVLDHIAGQRVDAVWNLGDVLSGPLAPAETAELLMPRGLVTIRGNHERQLLACAARPGGASDQYAFEHTAPHHREWLAGLPATAAPRPDVLLCHGTPRDDLELLLERVVGEDQHLAPLADIEARVPGVAARLIVGGHTHVPRVVRTRDGRTLVNPGSVGLPAYDSPHPDAATGGPARYYVEVGGPHASYAIVDDADAGWHVALHRVAYDWDAAAACAARNHRPEWAHALRTGFALRG